MTQQHLAAALPQVQGSGLANIWAVLKQFSPAIQQIVIIILQQMANTPAVVGATGPDGEVTDDEMKAICASTGTDQAALATFFAEVGPLLAKIIANLLNSPVVNPPAPIAPVAPPAPPLVAPKNPPIV